MEPGAKGSPASLAGAPVALEELSTETAAGIETGTPHLPDEGFFEITATIQTWTEGRAEHHRGGQGMRGRLRPGGEEVGPDHAPGVEMT